MNFNKNGEKLVKARSLPPQEEAFSPWGGVHEFVLEYTANPKLQADPEIKKLHNFLVNNSSVCSFCGVGCPYGVVLNSQNKEKVVPLSKLGLCVKGATSLLTGGDAQREERLKHRGKKGDLSKAEALCDRIRTPMIRHHDGSWKEVSWEEALDRAAWLFLHVREWVGPEGVAIYGNGQKTIEGIWMASLYKNVFKISTIGANSEHCLASAGAAHELNFGNEASFTWKEFEELEICDVAILHGTNPVVTFPQAYKKLKSNTKAIKVVIDPIESDTVIDLRQSNQPTLHIRFEQGGDALFNLAVARVILENDWEDREFLDQAVEPESFQELYNLCFEDRCTPENVAQQIALEGDNPTELAQTIRYYASLIAQPNTEGYRPKPAFVSSMGINQSTGSYGFSTNLNLLLLTGNVGRKGAGSLRIAGQSNATSELMLGFNARRLLFNLDATNPEHRRELAEILEIPEHNIPDSHGTPVSRMSDDDYLYCFIFMGTQFTRNMPRLGNWLKRLGRSFNIMIDSFLPDGALEYADVILPALTYTERMGVIQRGDRTLQLQQPLTEAPPLAWADEEILARLALAISNRLQDPDTAALNDLDPEVVTRTFGRYLNESGKIDSASVFDHVVSTSCRLNVYNRLINSQGEPISHAMLRENAGLGVQWQGDGRYGEARTKGAVFPGLRDGEFTRAKLVRPPEKFLERLVTRGDEKLRSLITGRGRPGRNPKVYVARYNSGIKTLPIGAKKTDETYWIEINPDYAAQRNLNQGDPVRITSHHGTIIGSVSLNAHVPPEFPFLDFVPGEANRLTDYLDADRFTNQSLIKRTPIRVERLSLEEATLWQRPDADVFSKIVSSLYQHYTAVYPTETEADSFARGEPNAMDWLPLTSLRQPSNQKEEELAVLVGAMATFFQRYEEDTNYRASAAQMLEQWPGDKRERFLTILLPLLRKLDYDTLMMSLLNDVVGKVSLLDALGQIKYANLEEAHDSATIEIKEEVVGVQLYLAIKYGLDLLYGCDSSINQDDIAIITGIRIPCAADVPSYFMGVSPADLKSSRLVHCAQIGSDAIVVIDRRNNRGVKIDTTTGILPYDRELLKLRRSVIMNKRSASRYEHRRFFDRLIELIVKFVRLDRENFRAIGPFPFPWEEFSNKLTFVPWKKQSFQQMLLQANLSSSLVEGLIGIEILDPKENADLIQQLLRQDGGDQAKGSQVDTFTALVNNQDLSTERKVFQVIEQYITPVLENDGGKLELLYFDASLGEVTVRFLGSCANCPSSILSVETLVKPPLLNIPGVYRVVHRTHLRRDEITHKPLLHSS